MITGDESNNFSAGWEGTDDGCLTLFVTEDFWELQYVCTHCDDFEAYRAAIKQLMDPEHQLMELKIKTGKNTYRNMSDRGRVDIYADVVRFRVVDGRPCDIVYASL